LVRLVPFVRKEAAEKEVAKDAAEKEATEREAAEKEDDADEEDQAWTSGSIDDDDPISPIRFLRVSILLLLLCGNLEKESLNCP
jgi:hypothetical protein